MKKLLMMVIMMFALITTNVKAVNILTNPKDISKIEETMNKVDLVVEGRVLSVERYYVSRAKEYKGETNRIMSENEITTENAGKVQVFTKIQLEVIETFSSKQKNFNESVITVWIDGGYIVVDGEKYVQFASNSGYPLLSVNDQMILGLNKTKNKGPLSKASNREYLSGYLIAENMQIPSSDEMINEVEEALYQRAYYKSLKNQDNSQTMSQLRMGQIEAQIEKEEKVQQQNENVENLRQNLRSKHE